MHSPPTDSSGGPNDLVVEIIETLETCGLEDDAYQLHDYVDVDALEQLVSSSDGDITVQFTVEGIPLEVSLDGVDVIVEDESECVTNNDVRCGDRECSRKPSTARRPATARDCVSLALVRFAHENAAARLVPAVVRGRGTAEAASPF